MDTQHARLPVALADGSLRFADGRRITFGPVGPEDRALIQGAMARLSPESSRRRFFTPRFRLSERELDALTSPSSAGRLAVGASLHWPDGRVEGVGLARYVRSKDEPDAAEVALTVIDDYQNLGIGRRLFQRLAREAFLRGFRRLVGLVLVENAPMLALLSRHARGVVRRRDAEHVLVEIPLPVPA